MDRFAQRGVTDAEHQSPFGCLALVVCNPKNHRCRGCCGNSSSQGSGHRHHPRLPEISNRTDRQPGVNLCPHGWRDLSPITSGPSRAPAVTAVVAAAASLSDAETDARTKADQRCGSRGDIPVARPEWIFLHSLGVQLLPAQHQTSRPGSNRRNGSPERDQRPRLASVADVGPDYGRYAARDGAIPGCFQESDGGTVVGRYIPDHAALRRRIDESASRV
jgi:hypothetical protein